MGDRAEPEIREAKRIRQFAAFFRNYMGISSFIVAALPIPVTMAKLIPVYTDDAGSISVITSLTCFLILAFIFFNRHSLARRLFEPLIEMRRSADGEWDSVSTGRWTSAPGRRGGSSLAIMIACLIFASALFFLLYLYLIMSFFGAQTHGHGYVVSLEIHRVMLIATYAAFFAAAEAAFVLMATKEYLQDLLGIPEVDLIYALQSTASTPDLPPPLPRAEPMDPEGSE